MVLEYNVCICVCVSVHWNELIRGHFMFIPHTHTHSHTICHFEACAVTGLQLVSSTMTQYMWILPNTIKLINISITIITINNSNRRLIKLCHSNPSLLDLHKLQSSTLATNCHQFPDMYVTHNLHITNLQEIS